MPSFCPYYLSSYSASSYSEYWIRKLDDDAYDDSNSNTDNNTTTNPHWKNCEWNCNVCPMCALAMTAASFMMAISQNKGLYSYRDFI
jgi:hypothetical protein